MTFDSRYFSDCPLLHWMQNCVVYVLRCMYIIMCVVWKPYKRILILDSTVLHFSYTGRKNWLSIS